MRTSNEVGGAAFSSGGVFLQSDGAMTIGERYGRVFLLALGGLLAGCLANPTEDRCETDDHCGVGLQCRHSTCVARPDGDVRPQSNPPPGGADCVPVREVCDGVDNDCDGAEDEGNPGAGGPCEPGAQGPCAGRLICREGALVCGDRPPNCCGGGEDAAPCNGCPGAMRVPDGWVCIPAGSFTMGSRSGPA